MANHPHALANMVPQSPAAVAAAAVESWENEGGHFPRFHRATRSRPAPRLPLVPELERLTAQVRFMARTLFDDLASGLIGTRHNTFAHRSRMLRQLTSRRDAMRETSRQEPSR